MFDFSWAELSVVALVGLLILGPKELQEIIRNIKKITAKVREIGREFAASLTGLEEVSDLKNEVKKVNDDIKRIVDLEGNLQDTYDISDLMGEGSKDKPKSDS